MKYGEACSQRPICLFVASAQRIQNMNHGVLQSFNRFQLLTIILLVLYIIFIVARPIFPPKLSELLSDEADSNRVYEGPTAVMHKLCRTPDSRDIVNLQFKQDGYNATASVLAGSSRVLPENASFIHEIDFLIMWERGGRAMPSYLIFTHCFIDWPLEISIKCEVVGFGTVNGSLKLSFHDHPKEGQLLCPVHTLKVPSNIDLEVRLIDVSKGLNGALWLCRLNPRRKIHRIIGCSQPLYNVSHLEKKWPGLIRMWARYYVDYLGFGYINIYDIDGSVEPYLGDLVKRGIVNYYKSWAPTESMRQLALNNATYCSETMMENQCVWQSRGVSEWAMLIHAPDNYLNDRAGLPNLMAYLNKLNNTMAMILLNTMIYGHPNLTVSKQEHAYQLFETIQIRECQPFGPGRHLPLVNPRKVLALFVHFAMEPFNSVPMLLDVCPVFVNHYVTMFRERSVHMGSADPSRQYCVDSSLHNETIPYRSQLE